MVTLAVFVAPFLPALTLLLYVTLNAAVFVLLYECPLYFTVKTGLIALPV